MGTTKTHHQVLRIVAIFSRHVAALDWAKQRMTEEWGAIRKAGPAFEFVETSYYHDTMGQGIQKQLVAFESLMSASALAESKLQSNAWEAEYSDSFSCAESRPLNIDPGYLTEAKLVLATTKDRDHRIYLRDGIFAEVTLYYHRGQWCARPWTYPDYQRDDVHDFLSGCRHDLRVHYNRS